MLSVRLVIHFYSTKTLCPLSTIGASILHASPLSNDCTWSLTIYFSFFALHFTLHKCCGDRTRDSKLNLFCTLSHIGLRIITIMWQWARVGRAQEMKKVCMQIPYTGHPMHANATPHHCVWSGWPRASVGQCFPLARHQGQVKTQVLTCRNSNPVYAACPCMFCPSSSNLHLTLAGTGVPAFLCMQLWSHGGYGIVPPIRWNRFQKQSSHAQLPVSV